MGSPGLVFGVCAACVVGDRSGFRKEAPPSSSADLLPYPPHACPPWEGQVTTQGHGRPHLWVKRGPPFRVHHRGEFVCLVVSAVFGGGDDS